MKLITCCLRADYIYFSMGFRLRSSARRFSQTYFGAGATYAWLSIRWFSYVRDSSRLGCGASRLDNFSLSPFLVTFSSHLAFAKKGTGTVDKTEELNKRQFKNKKKRKINSTTTKRTACRAMQFRTAWQTRAREMNIFSRTWIVKRNPFAVYQSIIYILFRNPWYGTKCMSPAEHYIVDHKGTISLFSPSCVCARVCVCALSCAPSHSLTRHHRRSHHRFVLQ